MPHVTQTAPRSWFSLFLAHHGWLAMLAGAMLFAMTILSVRSYVAASAMALDGVPIIAEVVNQAVTDGDAGRIYTLTFRYAPPEQVLAIKLRVSEAYFHRHPIGQNAEIF